ncbi:hypothetical protein [Halorubrum ezzemoulense]|uniref:hypothetical protein n=1 Tax=Halorubrum ezzemoulense TaxID=337243 RepID=UPI00111C6A41|nr:hypothetical protein [Halorubrum ezzemoulense]
MLAILGTFFTLVGTGIITYPDIVYLEKCYPTGRLLRAIETLESRAIHRDNTGFKELRAEINDIVEEYHLRSDIDKIDIYSSGIDVGGRVTNFKVIGYIDDEEVDRIEEPEFERIRFQIYRKIRRGKTKIRAYGIALVVLGFLIQGYAILY